MSAAILKANLLVRGYVLKLFTVISIANERVGAHRPLPQLWMAWKWMHVNE